MLTSKTKIFFLYIRKYQSCLMTLKKKENFIPGIPKEFHSHSRGMGNFGNDACFEIFHSNSHYSREFAEWPIPNEIGNSREFFISRTSLLPGG